jgi:hypothetical protein
MGQDDPGNAKADDPGEGAERHRDQRDQGDPLDSSLSRSGCDGETGGWRSSVAPCSWLQVCNGTETPAAQPSRQEFTRCTAMEEHDERLPRHHQSAGWKRDA